MHCAAIWRAWPRAAPTASRAPAPSGRRRRRCRRAAAPRADWDRARRYSSPAQSRRTAVRPTPIHMARRWRPGTRGPAPESNSSRLPASSRQPLPTRGFAAGVSGLTGLDRVNDYPCNSKCDLNYGNCPDMINASLTGPRSKRISRQTNGLLGRFGKRNDDNQARQAPISAPDSRTRN